jgi:hypothetical protein
MWSHLRQIGTAPVLIDGSPFAVCDVHPSEMSFVKRCWNNHRVKEIAVRKRDNMSLFFIILSSDL